MLRVLAVDLGASSVRVAAIDLDGSPPEVEIVHRYAHSPVRLADGSLRWDWDRIEHEVVLGLELGLARGPAASIGVDAWGVDYGLIDSDGRLLSPPHSYRDGRTAGWEAVARRLGERRLYGITGIQLMGINTIFQLAVHDRRELETAHRLLTVPELLVHALTGSEVAEQTSAGTTALMDVRSGEWSAELLADLELDPALLPPIETAPHRAGSWRGIPVHLVAGHDTASAVVALPGPVAPGAVFISSGTWMIVGAERAETDTSEAGRQANFSNEPGAAGRVCFLKNVMGLWMLEQLVLRWGGAREDVLSAAAALPAGGPVVDATHERFLAPVDMEEEVRAAAVLPAAAGRDRVARCVLDSLAVAAARVVRELGSFLPEPVPVIHMVGGGGRNTLLNRLVEEAAGIPVLVGSGEATALGNALVQGIALGRFADIEHARASL